MGQFWDSWYSYQFRYCSVNNSGLVNIAKDFDFSSNVKKELRQLIQICNKYLDNLNKLNLPHIIYKENDRWADLNFDSAMKQFRSGFKKSIENLSKETNVVVTFTIPEKW